VCAHTRACESSKQPTPLIPKPPVVDLDLGEAGLGDLEFGGGGLADFFGDTGISEIPVSRYRFSMHARTNARAREHMHLRRFSRSVWNSF